MYIPTLVILIVVFVFGWMMGIGGIFRDIAKNPQRFYEKHIKYLIEEEND